MAVLLLLLATGLQVRAQFYYGLRQEFGKNRVQYNEFDWVFYRFERYDVYFYRGNDELAAQVARMVDEQLPRVEDLLDAPLDERVQILIFNNLSDLKQSNVNSSDDEDYNSGGVTRISGRRLFLYFDGSYINLEKDLRSGLAEVVLSNLIYGSFTKSIRNSALLNLPEWYTEGLISYIGHPDDEEIETHVRDAYLSGDFKNINALLGTHARYAGHSMWEFINKTYGQKVVKNVVYMAIVNRNIESGFLYILGKDLEAIEKDWKSFLKEKYEGNDRLEGFPEKALRKAPKGTRITHMEVSEDGRYLAYVEQKFSRYKVFLYDFEKDKRKRLLTEGFRIAQNADHSYPLLTWRPDGEELAMITEKEGFIYLSFYNVEEKNWEEKPFYKFDKILSLEYSRDGKRFLLSAVKDGQSDIFIYTLLNTKVEQLTDDTYSDLNPAWIQNDTKVAWSSNRPSDSVIKRNEAIDFPRRENDLFAMPAAEPLDDTTVVWRMTNSPGIDETRPKQYADGYVAFLSNRSQIVNRHLIKIDSAIAFVDTTTHYEYNFKEYAVTNFKRSLLRHAYLPERDKNLDLVLLDGRYRLFATEYETPQELNLAPLATASTSPARPGANLQADSLADVVTGTVPLYYPGVNPAEFEVNIYDYQFEDAEDENQRSSKKEKLTPKPVQILPMPEALPASATEEKPLEIPPKRNYFLSFFQDDFTVRFDNMFDIPQYQRFTGFVSSDLLNAGFNMQFKVGVMDLMHDYRLIAGVRTNFQPLTGTSLTPNATFLVGLGDYKDRLDKEYTYTRASRVLITSVFDYQRIITHQGMAKASWPFNPVASLRGGLGYRLDQTIQLSQDDQSLTVPTTYQDYAIATLAYVYDNTRKIGLNLYSGLRFKLFTEYYRNLYRSPTGLHTAGIDARNYTIIYKNLIWANRFAGGTSFGPEKLIHIMGGVDNSFNPGFNPTTPIATENNYIFQTLVTNMRGFDQNIRNGNSFALINSELRWPVFSFLFKKPIRSDFIKNFQIIGFGDIGTAWNGATPYSQENAINTLEIPFGPQGGGGKIVLNSQKEPIVGSYGVGLRTRLFGYFLRFDWAWPVEDGLILNNKFSFSIGHDF